jgi:hypothetical protein
MAKVISFLLLTCCDFGFGFHVLAPTTYYNNLRDRSRPHSIALHERKEDDTSNKQDPNPITKLSWYAVEAFGRVFNVNNSPADPMNANNIPLDRSKPPTTIDETFQRIKLDNEREYFLSGQVDAFIYDTNCEFADPFV